MEKGTTLSSYNKSAQSLDGCGRRVERGELLKNGLDLNIALGDFCISLVPFSEFHRNRQAAQKIMEDIRKILHVNSNLSFFV